MRLPGGESAVVEITKLRDYCLNAEHPRGRYKARVFASALRITGKDVSLPRDKLLAAARTRDAVSGTVDSYGYRYTLDFACQHRGLSATVRTGWIVLHEEDFPRLTTCFVLL